MFTKKVCKGCGKSGLFLKLNKDNLCFECADLQKSEMSMAEIADELGAYVKGKGTPKKTISYMQKQEKKEQRESKNFNRVFGTYETARQLERQGETDRALSIYLKLLETCPPGTDYYIRPCIILEKKHEYAHAIQICDLAIKGINQGRFNADIADFEHRKNRLQRKLEKENVSTT